MADLTGAPDVLGGGDRRTRGLARQVPAFLWTTDRQLRITSAVDGGVVALGDEPDRVVGLPVEECFGSDAEDSSPIAAHRRALEGESGSFQLDRQGRRYQARVAPLWDGEGQIAGCIGFAQEISEHSQAPEELRRDCRELERQLEGRTAELGRANRQLDKESQERKSVEDLLRHRVHELDERVKELKCLYDMSYVLEQPGISLEEICQGLVDLIPSAWQYPEITCARIIVEDGEYRTENFSETIWKQASDVFVSGRRIGTVEVCYLSEKEESDEGPFLEQERSLLDAVAERLGKVTERFKAEQALRGRQRELRIRSRIAGIFLTVPDDEMYGEVLQVLLETLESKYGVFGYVDENGDLVCPSMTRDVWDRCQISDKDIRFPRETWGGIWGRALVERRTLYSNEGLRVPDGHIPIQRVVCAPVVHQSHTVGILEVANKATDYDEKDVQLLETIADRIAPILHARLQRDREERGRRRADEDRNRLVAELEAKNAELERFTYTVSHDLKSPLITIQGFVGQLEQDAASGKVDRMKGDMARIRHAAEEMHHFLDDLLELSRVGRVAKPSEEVSLGELAREAVELVGGSIAQRGAQVEISPELPIVFADRRRLAEVLQNLIENAVKFMGDQPEPRVEIGVRHQHDETVCYVRDNGVGINPRYHRRVFELFDKLDHRSEGTGVGLALVKRIIEVHGGRIWVESEGRGRGSAFCFVLPRKGEAPSHAH